MRRHDKKMHVLFIVENNTVPPDIRVWREANFAKNYGYAVSVISPRNKIFFKSFEVINGINIYRHPNFDHKGGVRNQSLEYLNAFFWEIVLAIKIYAKNPFHIIHAANPPDNIFIIALFFKLFGVKFIFDHHDIAPELYLCKFNGKKNFAFRILRLMEKLSCKSAEMIISTNRSFKDHVVNLHRIDKKKIYIARNDPDLEFFTKATNKSTAGINLLYVGSINVQDGVDLLIKVIHILTTQYKHEDLKCTIVGDGESLNMAKNLAKKYCITNFVYFTGYIYDRSTLHDLMKKADICLECAPDSEANRRSTFIKIMEYMAFGKAIVAFDLHETRESVGDTAILVKPNDIHEFAASIHSLIADPQIRIELGEKARYRIEEKLNWQKSTEILKMAYSNLIHSL